MAKKNAVVVLLFGAFIALGTLSTVAVYRDVRLGLSSEAWPVVKGEVVKAVRRSRSSNLNYFEYRYTVGHTIYLGSQFALTQRIPRRA